VVAEQFGMLEATPEVPAQRLAAQIGKHESSLILFLNENSVPSILSKLPTDITVRQLAKRPKGIVEDEANVSLLLQKAQ